MSTANSPDPKYAKHDQKVFVQLDVEYIDGKLEKESTLTSLTFTGKLERFRLELISKLTRHRLQFCLGLYWQQFHWKYYERALRGQLPRNSA
jgi:hypothetical protein